MLDILLVVRDAIFAILMSWMGADASETTINASPTEAPAAVILPIENDDCEDQVFLYQS